MVWVDGPPYGSEAWKREQEHQQKFLFWQATKKMLRDFAIWIVSFLVLFYLIEWSKLKPLEEIFAPVMGIVLVFFVILPWSWGEWRR